MPANQSQRPKFYEEQYLGAADLTAAVDYGRIQQARHALGAHTWGIAIGLQLKETPQAGGAVSVHLLPGYAWDGYGRPIVVLSPYKIPEEKFSAIKFDPSIDTDGKGRLIKLWLRYDESATQNPRPGFEVCDPSDQRSRIQETFRIEIGEQPGTTDRYSGITVAAKSLTDAKKALQQFDPAAPLVYDESVPQQTFPDPQDRARWLIPIGFVRWLPVQNQPGHFVARDDSSAGGAEKDSDKIRRVRRYIGVVTEEIEAADGAIRLRDRGKDPMSNFQWPTVDQITQSTNDLVWVEGNLRVVGNAKLCAGNLDFRDRQGNDLNAPLRIQRTEDAMLSVSALQVTIGSDSSKDHRFAIGPLKDGPVPGQKIVDEKFAVLSSGRVGIGTLTPNRALTIESNTGTYLNVRSTLGGGPFEVLLGADTSGGIVSTMTNHDLQLRAGGNDPKLIIKADGNVGIGTPTPYAKLTLNGSLGFTNNASPMMYIFESGTNNPEKAVVAHSRDFSNWGLFYNDPLDQMIFKASGSPVMTVGLGNGNVGIGLLAPLCKLHVVDSINAGASSVNAHVAVIENTSPGDDADVLALKVGINPPTSSNNFITFFGGTTAVGRIEGDGIGGISLLSGGADFAECLPRLRVDEAIKEGDIVGVFAGKITKVTEGSHHVTAITGRSVVVGNAPHAECEHFYDKVAFIGQVPVKVRGAVRAGDYIIPSGLNDGTGIAISPDLMKADQYAQVVGRAWESRGEEGIKAVNTAIGLASSSPGETLISLLRTQQEEIAALKAEIRKLAVLQTCNSDNAL